jgi:hypothetical protein
MDEVDCSHPTGGSIFSVGDGTDGSAEAGALAHTGVLISAYLQEHGYCLCTLVAMSHGCKNESSALLLDITTEPFVSMPTKAVKVFAIDYPNEVIWHYS